MRFFLGLVVGMLLTVAVAYLVDVSSGGTTTGTGTAQLDQKPLVNWDVVDRDWESLTRGVRNTWNRLTEAR